MSEINIFEDERAKAILIRCILDYETQGVLTQNVEQNYIMVQIKKACILGYNKIILCGLLPDSYTDKKAFLYLQSLEGYKWLKDFGYDIQEIVQGEIIISW